MVRLTGNGFVLMGAEGSSPPLPYIEVDENEARALIRSGDAILYAGSAELAAEWAEGERQASEDAQAALAAQATADAEAKAKADAESAAQAAAEADAKEKADADAQAEAERLVAESLANGTPLQVDEGLLVPGGEGEGGEGGQADDAVAARKQTIADALELVEDEHLVKTGARAGKPTLKAMEEITGLADLTVAEIDAVVADKAAE
jgi:hypothetical protein